MVPGRTLVIKDKIVQFDEVDADLVLKYTWYISNCNGYYYATAPPAQKSIRMHKLICGFPPFDVDHINKNTLDNRRENLRFATRAQNNANSSSRKGNSKYKGVRFDRGKWTAQIGLNYKSFNLGRFKTEDEAALAYNKAALEAWGEFAFINTIKE